MTGTIAPQREFRQVDPLIAHPPRSSRPQRFALPPTGFRPDIEGLRAIAVVLVVLFHADLGPFGGGFIGVDVFFVVSGFLITSLLLGEVSRTGTVSLPNFWARRARRLLPASCLVIAATLLAAQFLYDPLLLGNLAREAVAACGFVINLLFAAREAGGDGGYFDAELAKSPLLHFWSLAVEEQFYLVWPLVIWWMAKAARRFRHDLTLVMAAGWAASAVACVWLTDSNGPWAFYSLPTRAWELLTGALLAISLTSLRRIPPRRRGPDGRRRAGDHPRRRGRLRLLDDLPRRGGGGAGARHRARDRGRLRQPRHGRCAHRPRLCPAAVDRPALLRHLPLALAGAGPHRDRVGAAVRRPAAGGGRRVGGPGGGVVPAGRGPGPPLVLAGAASPPQPAHRGVDPRRAGAPGGAVPGRPPIHDRRYRGGQSHAARPRRARRPGGRRRVDDDPGGDTGRGPGADPAADPAVETSVSTTSIAAGSVPSIRRCRP